MGQVVMARLDHYVEKRYNDFAFGDGVPIWNVSGIDMLGRGLLELVHDRKLLQEQCAWSTWWIEHFYRADRIVSMWEDLYDGKQIGVPEVQRA